VVKEQGGGCYRRYVDISLSPQLVQARLMEVVAHGDILRWIADGQSQGYMSSRVSLTILFSLLRLMSAMVELRSQDLLL
jgi:hypothetical protein